MTDLPDWERRTLAPAKLLQSFNFPAGVFTTSAVLPLPAGTHAVRVYIPGIDFVQPQQVELVDNDHTGSVATWNNPSSPALLASCDELTVPHVSVSITNPVHAGTCLIVAETSDQVVAIANDPSLAVPVTPGRPSSANLVRGYNSANGSTVITVPAGRIWFGSVGIGVQGSTTVRSNVSAQFGGSAVAAAGADTGTATYNVSPNVYLDNSAGGAGAALTLSTFNTPQAVECWANGLLL